MSGDAAAHMRVTKVRYQAGHNVDTSIRLSRQKPPGSPKKVIQERVRGLPSSSRASVV